MLGVRHGVTRHVARSAVVRIRAAGGRFASTVRQSMAGQTFRAKPARLLAGLRYEMWIVTGAAPHPIAGGPLARAFRQVLDVTGHLHRLRSSRAHEGHGIVRE